MHENFRFRLAPVHAVPGRRSEEETEVLTQGYPSALYSLWRPLFGTGCRCRIATPNTPDPVPNSTYALFGTGKNAVFRDFSPTKGRHHGTPLKELDETNQMVGQSCLYLFWFSRYHFWPVSLFPSVPLIQIYTVLLISGA